MSALKPCGHCGGGAGFVRHSTHMPKGYKNDQWDAVACQACGLTIGACDRRFRSREEAAKAWNHRIATSPSAEPGEAAGGREP